MVAVVVYVGVGVHRNLGYFALHFLPGPHSQGFVLPVWTAAAHMLLVVWFGCTASRSTFLLLFLDCSGQGVLEVGVVFELISDQGGRCWLVEDSLHALRGAE